MTTCNYGKTTQRQVFNGAPQAKQFGIAVKDEAVKVIKLSFLEKTMSKVKLL